MGRLDINELERNGFKAIPSVVPTIQQIIERNKQKEKEEIIEKSTLSKLFIELKDKVQSTQKSSSIFLVGSEETGDDVTTIPFEYYGDKESVSISLGHCMVSSPYVVSIVNMAIKYYVNECSPKMAEVCASALEEIVLDLKKRNDIDTRIKLLRDEVSRNKKDGNYVFAQKKDKELQELIQKRDKDKKRRQDQLKSLENARAAKAEKKRKEDARKKEMNRQQPNFAKMAKKKMQKIAERKAEKRKKTSCGEDKIKSCSMFSNVG